MTKPINSYQGAQSRLALESVYGQVPGSPAWKRINGFGVVASASVETDTFAPPGSLVPTIVLVNDDFSQGSFDGRLDFNGLPYIFSSLFGPATITDLGGTPNAYSWVWTWNGKTATKPTSYTCDYGFPDSADRVTGMIFNNVQVQGGRADGFDVSGDLLGKKMTMGQKPMGGATNEVQSLTITGTPTGGTFTLSFNGQTTATIVYNAAASVVQTALENLSNIGVGNISVTGTALPGGTQTITFDGVYAGTNVAQITGNSGSLTGGSSPTVTVTTTTPGADSVTDIAPVPAGAIIGNAYLDHTAWTDLGTTQLLDMFAMNYQIGDRQSRVRPVNKSLSSDALIDTSDQTHTLAMTLAVNDVERALMTRMRAGTLSFARMEWVSDTLISGANAYTLQLDQAVFWNDIGDPSDTDGVQTREWTGRVAYDATSGNALKITLINGISGL